MADVAAAAEVLRLSRVFPVSVERLYAALVSESEVSAWLHPGTMSCAECHWPAAVGASWRVVMVSAEGNRFPVGGRFLAVEPDRRLRFTWVWESGQYAGIETIVTLSIKALADGAQLTVLHEGLPSVAAREAHREGWTSTLDNLAGRTVA